MPAMKKQAKASQASPPAKSGMTLTMKKPAKAKVDKVDHGAASQGHGEAMKKVKASQANKASKVKASKVKASQAHPGQDQEKVKATPQQGQGQPGPPRPFQTPEKKTVGPTTRKCEGKLAGSSTKTPIVYQLRGQHQRRVEDRDLKLHQNQRQGDPADPAY